MADLDLAAGAFQFNLTSDCINNIISGELYEH